ncbi:MAG TPA: polymer-forming cytoskeletal protein [Terracidiphilus sp.]|jgi:cytoskeletal protein CcmA (bactofilin family)
MWTSSDSKKQSDEASTQPATSSLIEMPGTPAPSTPQNQYSMIGASIKIKGTVTASDPVYVYGCIEGSISAPAHRVTVGKEGRVKANISAREVVIMGEVNGNLEGGERVEIRCDGSLTGDLVTHRIYVEDGATLSGSIDVQKPKKVEKPTAQQELHAVLEPREPKAETVQDVDREAWADLAVSEIA